MKRKVIKSYVHFVNEGKREQDKIDQLLEIMAKRKLTEEERNLLSSLSKGGSLPEEDKPVYKKNKLTNDLETDDVGNVIVEEDPGKAGSEFVTSKGKQNSVDKIKIEDIIDARVYKNKTSEENVFFAYTTSEKEGVVENNWIIYRTGSMDKYPLGQFMDVNAPKYIRFKTKTPEQMWKDLDFEFDFGMILDQDIYEDFINFVELYKESQVKHAKILQKLRSRFVKLI